MDPLTIMEYVQLGIKYGPTIINLIQKASSNEEIGAKISELAPEVGGLVADLGSRLFPHSTSALQQVGGAIAAFDADTTKWVQKACNQLLEPDPQLLPLKVDGKYGPKTRTAVERLQNKYGLKVDGLAGKVTQKAIEVAMGALSTTH
jgi:peptidoglycan hydrolase-like protein with peptidoglycan-binding domain